MVEIYNKTLSSYTFKYNTFGYYVTVVWKLAARDSDLFMHCVYNKWKVFRCFTFIQIDLIYVSVDVECFVLLLR